MGVLVALTLEVTSVTYPTPNNAVIHLAGFTLPPDAVSANYTEDYPYTVQPEGDFRGFQFGFTYSSPVQFGDPFVEIWRAGTFFRNFTNTPSHVPNSVGGYNWSDLGYWYFGGFDLVATEVMNGAEIHIDTTGIETLFPASGFKFQVFYYMPGAPIEEVWFASPIRQRQRADGLGLSSASRTSQLRTKQGSLRGGPNGVD